MEAKTLLATLTCKSSLSNFAVAGLYAASKATGGATEINSGSFGSGAVLASNPFRLSLTSGRSCKARNYSVILLSVP